MCNNIYVKTLINLRQFGGNKINITKNPLKALMCYDNQN